MAERDHALDTHMKRILPMMMLCIVFQQMTMRVNADLSPEEKTKLVEERAALTFAGNEDQRADAVKSFSSEFLDPKQFWILLYLAEDSSAKVRRAAIWNIGNLANQIPQDKVKPIAELLLNEYQKIQHTDPADKDTDAIIQSVTVCAWALHQVYFFCPVVSAGQFSDFESHDYINLMTTIARRESNQTVFHAYFLTMIEGVLTPEGVQGLLPLLKELIANENPSFVTGILLELRDQYFLNGTDTGQLVFRDWLKNNAPLFEMLFKQYSAKANIADDEKQALNYLRDEILPRIQAEKAGDNK